MNLFTDTYDEINAIERDAPRQLTIDQRIALAQAKALLSISQELSKIHHEGINPEYSAGRD